MADTTIDKVLAIAPHLATLDSSTIQMLIDDAIFELEGTALADNEKAQRYLVAHYGTITIRRPSDEKIAGEIDVSYESNQKDFGTSITRYGQEFDRISKSVNGITFRLFS
ncbi:MAG: DUF4054 domain-containing protein [Vallitaleaceae bacterium]|nr:DUF4054 domain-containing protein [Vallitaleaceae bacterium]